MHGQECLIKQFTYIYQWFWPVNLQSVRGALNRMSLLSLARPWSSTRLSITFPVNIGTNDTTLPIKMLHTYCGQWFPTRWTVPSMMEGYLAQLMRLSGNVGQRTTGNHGCRVWERLQSRYCVCVCVCVWCVCVVCVCVVLSVVLKPSGGDRDR